MEKAIFDEGVNRYAGKTEYFPVKKGQVERNTVQETLVIPLYVHMLCTKAYPNEQAAELIARLNVDFKVWSISLRA